jgi:hypothetical protein
MLGKQRKSSASSAAARGNEHAFGKFSKGAAALVRKEAKALHEKNC